MGGAIVRAIESAADLRVAAVWVRDASVLAAPQTADSAKYTDDINEVAAISQVLIDFSLPGATEAVVEAVTANRIPLVCGVSGLSDAQLTLLDKAAETVAIVYDRNMSLGAAVLDNLARQAAVSLGLSFDVLIEETHHIHKVDAPSGTALKLGEAIAAARGQAFAEVAHFEPDAGTGDPPPHAIRFRSERRGEVPGDHVVTLSSPSETLTLKHSVTTRQVFADGALRAARWVVKQPAGRYCMRNVLF
jgi:4-hydroxy-tetrahydrodipicolinate reductase